MKLTFFFFLFSKFFLCLYVAYSTNSKIQYGVFKGARTHICMRKSGDMIRDHVRVLIYYFYMIYS